MVSAKTLHNKSCRSGIKNSVLSDTPSAIRLSHNLRLYAELKQKEKSLQCIWKTHSAWYNRIRVCCGRRSTKNWSYLFKRSNQTCIFIIPEGSSSFGRAQIIVLISDSADVRLDMSRLGDGRASWSSSRPDSNHYNGRIRVFTFWSFMRAHCGIQSINKLVALQIRTQSCRIESVRELYVCWCPKRSLQRWSISQKWRDTVCSSKGYS